MPTLALESHYWDSQPHRPACITVRDDIGRLYTHPWDHDPEVEEDAQHYYAVRGWLHAQGLIEVVVPQDCNDVPIFSARWRTGW